MRSAWLLTLALLAANLAAAPGAHAAAADKPLLSDSTGDTTLSVLGGGSPVSAPAPATGQTNSADLTSLGIVESDTSLLFTLGVAGLGDASSFDQYAIHFDWRNISYTAWLYHEVLPAGQSDSGSLTAVANDDKNDYYSSYGSYVSNFDVKVDGAKGTFSFEIPKAYVLDGLKRMPNRGDNLTNIYVESEDMIVLFTGGLSVTDRMPDADGAKLTINIGDEAHGHLRLQSPDRVRVSNGGAATFVYSVTLQNNGDSEDTVDLAMRDMPANWNGTVQTPVKIPGHGQKTMTVLASVPFAHVHGGFSAFNLTAASQNDPNSYAVLNMGVLHTPIPQPAGHHDTLYLHPDAQTGSLFEQVAPYTTGVMNTEAPKSEETTQEMSMTGTRDGNGWTIPLNPQLQMGLDFDLARVGTIAGTISAHETVANVKLVPKVYLISSAGNGNAKPILLASAKGQDLTLSANGQATFSMQLTPTEESDYIPYEPHQNMVLSLTLDSSDGVPPCCINIDSMTSPTLKVDGFKMTLPLNEYADQLTGISEAASAIDLRAEGPVEKTGRPGTLMTYTFQLQNTGFTADTFVVEAAGGDAKYGSVVPGGEINLQPKETKQITLGVAIPSDYKDSQSLEVILFAHAKSDPSKMALQRTKTLVATTGNASKDETKLFLAAKDDAKKSPGFEGIALVGAAVIAVGIASLRRRR